MDGVFLIISRSPAIDTEIPSFSIRTGITGERKDAKISLNRWPIETAETFFMLKLLTHAVDNNEHMCKKSSAIMLNFQSFVRSFVHPCIELRISGYLIILRTILPAKPEVFLLSIPL